MGQTIGGQLKQAREARNLAIAKVVEETRIRAHYIEAMEADNFDFLPSAAQARGFLRLYAEFLGLSMEELISRQRESAAQEPVPASLSAPAPAAPAAEADARPKKAARARKPAQAPTPAEPPPPVEEPAPVPESPAETGPAAAPSPSTRMPTSQAIFASIGEQLRARRESLSLTLEEVERHIHVRKHYLQALESGQLDRLPSSVQTRGMLNNYARFLEMDLDNVLLRFAEGLQAGLQERRNEPVVEAPIPEAQAAPRRTIKLQFKLPENLHLPARIRLPAGLRRYLSADLLVGGGLTLFLVIFAIWGTSRVVSLRSAPTPQTTAPSILDVLIASPAGTTAPLATASQQPTSAAAAGDNTQAAAVPTGQGPVQVVVGASASTWVRISVDGKTQFEGVMNPGTATSYSAGTQIEVVTGDGSAVRITYNQSDLGPMGNLGEVVDRIYTANAVLNPTPTFTPSPTKSPRPSITVPPSATPRFSPVPSQTPTLP